MDLYQLLEASYDRGLPLLRMNDKNEVQTLQPPDDHRFATAD